MSLDISNEVQILPTLKLVKTTQSHQIYICPFCDDKKGHLYVDKKLYLFICFKCNAAGHIKTLNLPYNIIACNEDDKLKSNNKSNTYQHHAIDFENAYQYLMQRLEKMKLHNIVDLEFIHFLPVNTFDKRYCWFEAYNGFIGRCINDNNKFLPKYKLIKTAKPIAYYQLFDKRKCQNSNFVSIVEGVFDAISTYYHFNIPNVIAVFNKAITDRIQKLIKLNVIKPNTHLLIFLDNDNLSEVSKLKNTLKNSFEVYMPVTDDMGSITDRQQLRKINV